MNLVCRGFGVDKSFQLEFIFKKIYKENNEQNIGHPGTHLYIVVILKTLSLTT